MPLRLCARGRTKTHKGGSGPSRSRGVDVDADARVGVREQIRSLLRWYSSVKRNIRREGEHTRPPMCVNRLASKQSDLLCELQLRLCEAGYLDR